MRWLLLALALSGLALAQPPPERKLVFLRSQGLTSWAESDPSFDYTCYLPRRYSLSGLDPQLIRAAASSGGLPARLLGSYSGDRVRVAPPSLRLEPPLLPLSLSVRHPWRGVVALRQGSTQMAMVPGQWQPCKAPLSADGLYQVTAWTQHGETQLQDLLRLGEIPLPSRLVGPLQAVVSEGFVQRTMDLYREAHSSLFRWQEPGGRAGFEVSRLGLTTLTGSLRSYGSLSGEWSGLGKWVEGEWEAPLQVQLSGGWARLQVQAQGQSLRLVRPIFAEVPQSWADGMAQLAQRFFSAPMAMPIPGAYLEPLLSSALVTQVELDQLQLLPGSWGDRRSGCLLLTSAAPASKAPPAELAWTVPDGFALGLSAAALNRSFQKTLPAHLPIRIDLPKGSVPSQQVFIFKLDLKQIEIQQLHLSYQRGAFRFDPCELAVGWQLGPLSGVEPGARLVGWASPALENGQMVLKMSIEQLQFLSPHILSQSPEEQQRLREQILLGLQKVPLPLPLPVRLPTEVHPQAVLEFTQLHPTDECLWLVGRWSDQGR